MVQRIDDKDRPDEAFTTDRAVRAGRANAASGRIMVTVPGDWFGPIPPEHDPRGLVRHALSCKHCYRMLLTCHPGVYAFLLGAFMLSQSQLIAQR